MARLWRIFLSVPPRRLGVGLAALGCILALVGAEAGRPAAALAGSDVTLRAQSRTGTVLGYYVPYDSSSWTSLQTHLDQLDIVAAQAVSIDACGNIGSRDDQTLKRLARASNVTVLPSLFTISGWLNHQLLTDDATSAHAIEQIVNYTLEEEYAGFDLDLEGVNAEDRPALTQFVGWLAAALHEEGKLLTLAIPAKERDVTVGWAGAYDYTSLGAAADLVTIMAYEYRGPFSGPGSVAPYDWVQRVTSFAASQMPPERVMLGIAFYGYDWNTTSGSARAIGFPQFAALAERVGTEPTFDSAQQSLAFGYETAADELSLTGSPQQRLVHEVTVRTPPPCDLKPPLPAATPQPKPAPAPGTPQAHEVWIEDSASAAARLQLAGRYGVGGISAWRLGLEDPNVWSVLAAWRHAD
jgi:spore germination protein